MPLAGSYTTVNDEDTKMPTMPTSIKFSVLIHNTPKSIPHMATNVKSPNVAWNGASTA